MRFLSIAFLILLSKSAFAQGEIGTTQFIRGVVTEQMSGKAIPDVSIVLQNTTLAVLTDENGKFQLNSVPIVATQSSSVRCTMKR